MSFCSHSHEIVHESGGEAQRGNVGAVLAGDGGGINSRTHHDPPAGGHEHESRDRGGCAGLLDFLSSKDLEGAQGALSAMHQEHQNKRHCLQPRQRSGHLPGLQPEVLRRCCRQI